MNIFDLILKEYIENLSEAINENNLSSAIANYLRLKYQNLSRFSEKELLLLIDTSINDMIVSKGLFNSFELKQKLKSLVIKDLQFTNDYPRPIRTQIKKEPEKEKFSIKRLFFNK